MTGLPTLDDWRNVPADARAAWIAALADPDAALVALGDACEQLARTSIPAALAAENDLLAAAPRAGRGRVRVLRAMTTTLAYAGRHEESIAAADEAIRAAEAGGLGVESARAAIASLHPLAETGRIAEAIERGERARASLIALGEPSLAGRADINLGNIYKSIGDAERAARHLDAARGALTHDVAMLAHIENALGEAHWLRDDFIAARRAFESAAAHFRATRQTFASAVVDGNLADVAAREGRLQDSLAHFEQARRVFETDGAKSHLARITAEEAEVLEALGATSDALRALDGALAWLEANSFPAEAARGRLARARVLAGVGRLIDAESDADIAAITAATRGDATIARRARLLKSELALHRGEATEAAHIARSVLDDPASTPLDRIRARHHAGLAECALGATASGRTLLDAAIAECRELDIGALLADLLVARAMSLPDPAQRVAELSEAVSLVERLRASLRADRLRASWIGSRVRAYEALALARLSEGTPESLDAAFETVERSKSRALLDLVQRAADRALAKSETPSDAPAGDVLAAEYERLRQRLSALYSRWESDGGSGQRLGGALPSAASRAALREAESELERLTRRLAETRGPAALTAAPATTREIRARLARHERLVEFFVADGEVLGFVLAPEGISVHRRLATASNAATLATRVLFQMRKATRTQTGSNDELLDAANAPLAALYDLLLRPLEAALSGADTVAIVPHGALHGVPFHALYDAQRATYAIERWKLRTAPSATLATSLRSHAAPAPRETLVVGIADQRAPAISAEAQSIASIWPDATMLLDGDATATRVLAECAAHRIVHLACHGRFTETAPNASGLRLGDRWASVREILDVSMRADLVVLAGCETGRSALEPGDEAVGLPRAFLAAGALSVLVSLWPVRDDAARAFMIDLHERLAGPTRAPLAAVVRETMLARMSEDPHPAIWGAFSLAGTDPWASVAATHASLSGMQRKGC